MLNQDLFKDLEWMLEAPGSKEVRRYPLTDMYVAKDDSVVIDIAVAGFDKDDIDIELVGDTLVITGKLPDDEDKDYIQEFISKSDFERKIRLGKHHINGEIKAGYKNGILTITVSKTEEPKKLIEIY